MKISYLALIFLFLLIGCDADKEENLQSELFGLSKTALNFSNAAGEKSVAILGTKGAVSVTLSPEGTEWCKTELKNGDESDSLHISVEENIRVKSRSVIVKVNEGDRLRQLYVLQSGKIFTHVPKVLDLSATPGPGQIKLNWTEPEEDNFDHVKIIVSNEGSVTGEVTLAKGVTEYLVTGLLSSAGEYLIEVESFDYENEPGEIASVTSSAGKNIAFRFKSTPPPFWVEYYLRNSDQLTAVLQVGSNEFNPGEKTTVTFNADLSLLDNYNAVHDETLELMPSAAYSLKEFQYEGVQPYQDMSLKIDLSGLEDRHAYAIPLKIQTVSSSLIDPTDSRCLLIFLVDDLAGWYTVERLPKCGEPASAYPEGKRRYIRRTGDYTWETGYLFKAYADEEQPGQSDAGTSIQYITINPETKALHIQQGTYAAKNDQNRYDPELNELIIEYEYSAWAGWWTHERMYNRSFTR